MLCLSRKYVQIEDSQPKSNVVISYHKHNLKSILVHYIYHNNTKDKSCENGFAPSEKMISHNFKLLIFVSHCQETIIIFSQNLYCIWGIVIY
jgi:hypothetical protein